jgi:hypothetical protein
MLTNHETNTLLSIHSTSPLALWAKIWFLWARVWVEKWFLVRVREALRALSNSLISKALEASLGIDSCLLLLKIASRRLCVSRWVPSWCGAPEIICISPLLGGEFLVSTNLPLWGLGEEKRLLVIAHPLWDPQRRRSFLCGSELRIKSCVSFACLSSLSFSNPRTCLCLIYLLVVFQLISLVARGS